MEQAKIRKVRQIVTGTHQTDGAGVHLVRVIGHSTVYDFDPFLMLDAFDSTNPDDYILGFPWHPHRGIETVTYLVQGLIEHGDSLGNAGTINDGCCQWMTAGGGIIHQEMPQASPRMLGLQLWINLPAKDKMTAPQYRDLRADRIPLVREEGCNVAVLAGSYGETQGATQGDYVRTRFLAVELQPGHGFSIPADPEETLFIYAFSGSGSTGPNLSEPVLSRRAILFDDGDRFAVRAGEEGLHFVLVSGRPLHEPIAWGGPIVMNTKEQLRKAFADLDAGTFIAGTSPD